MLDWLMAKLTGKKKARKPKLEPAKRKKKRKRRLKLPPAPPVVDAAADAAMGQPKLPRLHPGWKRAAVQVKCADKFEHPVYVIRDEHGVAKAIDTACGVAAARAAFNLGADNCWPAVEYAIDMLKGMHQPQREPQRMANGQFAPLLPGQLGQTVINEISEALGGDRQDHERLVKRESRRTRDQIPDFDRSELTRAASLGTLARVAGPGTNVVYDSNTATITVQYAGKSPDAWSTYKYILGSWGAGSGPQASDAFYRMLNRLGPHIRHSIHRVR